MVWKPSGIVTLLTDFGLRDAYVGIMHGVLSSRAPDLRRIVDLTHAVPAQDVSAAAFHLAHAWSWFPPGTVHLAVVDPGVGSERRVLAAIDRGHAFVAPDNGLLGPVLGEGARVWELDVERVSLPRRSRTFHGRDVFSPAAAALASGTPPDRLGQPTETRQALRLPAPRRGAGPDTWQGEVLLVDHFGNLVTNLPAELLGEGEGRRLDGRITVRGRTIPVRGTYADAGEGELLALVDSYDLVEVAVRGGSAAKRLECGVGEPIEMGLPS